MRNLIPPFPLCTIYVLIGLPRVNLRASLSTLAPVALSENACAYLIGATDTVNYIFDHVRANISRVTTTYFRKTIGLISRCPRGGKTTIVQLLHQRLRAVGTNVQTISFNGVSGFVRIAGENPVESLYRLITNQLDDTIGKQAPRLVNWEDLDCYIGEAPFVLIIDELNVLCTPIGSELALVLKTFFLDKRNRYLVVTSHQPFLEECATNDEDSSGQRNLPRMWSDSVSLLSDRSLTLIPMPTSNNVEQLQSMHTTACSRITNALAAYYGYMPSLMYAVCVQSEESPAVRFSRVVRGTSSDWPELIEFVKAVMTGVPSQRLQRFMCFVSSAEVTSGVGIQVKWPLCYTASILRHYPGREPYGDIAGCIDKLEVDCEMVGNGVVWEQSVRIAILFKFVLAVSCAWDLPFGLCRPEEAQGAHVIVQHLGMGIITTEQCKRVIQDRKKKFLANTLVLFIPTEATLTQFDGYCVRYQEAEVRNVCAYQCKDNNKGADGVVPDWISEGGHLLRSDAPGKCRTTGQNNKRWTYYDAADTDGLLGWSLRVMRL